MLMWGNIGNRKILMKPVVAVQKEMMTNKRTLLIRENIGKRKRVMKPETVVQKVIMTNKSTMLTWENIGKQLLKLLIAAQALVIWYQCFMTSCPEVHCISVLVVTNYGINTVSLERRHKNVCGFEKVEPSCEKKAIPNANYKVHLEA